MKLSEIVDRKFVECIDANDWEVDTPSGYKPILSSNKTIEYQVYRIELDNGLALECADTHILIDEYNQEVFAKQSIGCNIITKHGIATVISVIKTSRCENMYDLTVDSDDHTYFTNGILSHNTTVSAAYILWYTNFHADRNIAILANKLDKAVKVLAVYKFMFEELPSWLQQGVKKWGEKSIKLENNSGVFASATTSSGIRGDSCNMVYIDEAAFIAHKIAEAFFTAISPTISSGSTTKILISSTPKGYNYFYRQWNDAITGASDYIPLQINYWEIPNRDDKWVKEQRRELKTEQLFAQEILCSFIGSSNTLLPADILAQLTSTPKIYSNNDLDVFVRPEQEHIYIIVVDVSKGVGGDYSTFLVFDVTNSPYKVVAKYRNNVISPLMYPTIISKIGKDYNDAYILVENNISEQVGYILHNELEYENLLFVTRTGYGQRLCGGFGANGAVKIGVSTDKKVKREGCSNFKSIMENRKMLIQDVDIISELTTFIEYTDKGTFAAEEGYHDDLVMPLILFSWMTTQEYFKDITSIDTRRLIYDARARDIEENMTPFGWYDNGIDGEEILYNF